MTMKTSLTKNGMGFKSIAFKNMIESVLNKINDHYSPNDGLYLEEKVGDKVLIASIPAIQDLDECSDGWAYFGNNEESFVSVIGPFTTAKIEGTVSWMALRDYYESNGAEHFVDYYNNVEIEFNSAEIKKTNYENYKYLIEGLK